MRNIFRNLPKATEEVFEEIVLKNGMKLERIISEGHKTPEGEWLVSDKEEWVLVLRGQAKLRFENNAQLFELSEGDYLSIPAKQKHRVDWTDPVQPTIWLALHY